MRRLTSVGTLFLLLLPLSATMPSANGVGTSSRSETAAFPFVFTTVNFSYGHYYVKAPVEFEETTRRWVKDVNDYPYPIMAEALGFQPTTDFYIVEFGTPESDLYLKEYAGYYDGVKTVDGLTGGRIVLLEAILQVLQPVRGNLAYVYAGRALTHETIHGFLEPLKLNWDESFDVIIEIETLTLLNQTEFVKTLHDVYYQEKQFPLFAVLWDIREDFGWSIFQEFFREYAPLATDDNTLCHYLSEAANSDLSSYFGKYGLQVETVTPSPTAPTATTTTITITTTVTATTTTIVTIPSGWPGYAAIFILLVVVSALVAYRMTRRPQVTTKTYVDKDADPSQI